MFGVNYKYELNEQKGLIKLRPTIGSTIAFAVVTFLSFAVPMLALSAFVERVNEPTPDNKDKVHPLPDHD